MEIRYARNSGHSLITWAVLFSLVIAVLALFHTQLKRALQDKMISMSDYAVWRYWGETPRRSYDLTSETKSIHKQHQVTTKVEVKPGMVYYQTQVLTPTEKD